MFKKFNEKILFCQAEIGNHGSLFERLAAGFFAADELTRASVMVRFGHCVFSCLSIADLIFWNRKCICLLQMHRIEDGILSINK